MRKPIITLDRFIEAHLSREAALNRYLASGWGRGRFETEITETLAQRATMSLYATNGIARIEIACAAKGYFDQVAHRLQPAQRKKLWFITVAPNALALPIQEAANFDEGAAIAWARKILDGTDYVAVIEPAYFSNLKKPPSGTGGIISWHFHVLIWGCSEGDLDRLLTSFRREPECLVPGKDAVHARRLSRATFVGRALYMLKAPLSEYRVYPIRAEVADLDTGEILTGPTGKFRSKKRALRPGDAMRMCQVLGKRTIPMLSFAGGEGKTTLARTLRGARISIRARDRARRDQIERLFTGLE